MKTFKQFVKEAKLISGIGLNSPRPSRSSISPFPKSGSLKVSTGGSGNLDTERDAAVSSYGSPIDDPFTKLANRKLGGGRVWGAAGIKLAD